MGKVINFHKVIDANWFEKALCFLMKKYSMISLDHLIEYYYNGEQLPKNCCLITVDDGDETSYSIIYPILQKYKVPALFFVSPEKMIGSGQHRNFWFQEARSCKDSDKLMGLFHKDSYTIEEIWRTIDKYKSDNKEEYLSDQNMTLDQVIEIDQEGLVAIGAHTMDHPFLSRESEQRAKYEIIESLRLLELQLGHPILSFAYPNGRPNEDFGQREIDILQKTSCIVAFSTNAKDFSSSDNPFSIPRYGLSNGSIPFIYIKLKLGRWYKYFRKILRCFMIKKKR